MIRGDDRVEQVLRRDEDRIEAFVAASPVFERLRNPLMRRTMARLVTVSQAARIAGVGLEELLARLNGTPGEPRAADSSTARRSEMILDENAPTLAEPAFAEIVDLDVREDLRNGQEPFQRIMRAKQSLPAGAALRLRAIFEPVPLYAVMRKQGYAHRTRQRAADDWEVTFFPAEADAGETGPVHPSPSREEAGESVVVLDVRGLEPPEPMVRTLAALEELPEGGTLVQLNVCTPEFLLPRPEERGFSYEIREQGPGLVRVFIRKRA